MSISANRTSPMPPTLPTPITPPTPQTSAAPITSPPPIAPPVTPSEGSLFPLMEVSSTAERNIFDVTLYKGI